MNKIKLNQLEMLLAVVDTGSFGAAAAELDCTQSRISHAITELEQSIGSRLLARSRTGSIPTEAGHRVIAKARQIVRLADSLTDNVEDNATVIGEVRLACFRSIGIHLLPHALQALSVDYPGIRIDIDDGCEERDDVTTSITEGRAEIGIAQLPVSQALVSRPFASDSYVLVLPVSKTLRAPVTWEQLDDLPYIQLKCSGAFAILEQCRAAGFNAQPARTVATDTGITAMVSRGMGYSILPRLATFPEPDGIKTLALPIAAKRQLALVALPETSRLKPVQIVMRYLRNKQIMMKTDAFRLGLLNE